MSIENKKLFGILLCAVVGGIILFAGLVGSAVDQTSIKSDVLTDYNDGWRVEAGGKVFEDVKTPIHLSGVELGDLMVLTKELPADVDHHEYLFFRASHQKVKVFFQDKEAYRFGWNESRLFAKTPACTWILIPLNATDSGAEVRIELLGIYPRYANRVNEIYIGDKSAIQHEIAGTRLGSIAICLILIALGFSMFLVSTVLRRAKVNTALQRLGILTFLIGIWSICVTNTLQLLYGNVYVLLNLEFFTFNLLLPVFLWFLMSFRHYEHQKWVHWFFWGAVLEFLTIEILQFANISDYMETIVVTHGMMACVMGTIIVAGVRDLLLKHAAREEKMLVISIVLLLMLALIDMFRFYQSNVNDEGFFTRIGTLIFIAMWSLEVIHNISGQFVDLAKTEALAVLAYEDLMTGLKNRTAFEEWLNRYENAEDHEDAYIVAFDMNGLKDINDNYGHMKGDQAITAFAGIIKDAFEPWGTCYRTGGDEICAILPVKFLSDENGLKNILAKIEQRIADESSMIHMDFSAAVGYSRASAHDKKDIYQAYREADRLMYVCKQQMKCEN